MRTLLSQFCEEFEGVVRPILRPLQRSTDTLGAATPGLPARQILPGLRDARHGLEALAEKVAGQQAYVLIFGPLKSGKSTLMNAMSAAYVSEVTCLPAYPCMVYVSHSESRELKVTRYSGDTSTYSDPSALRLALTRAHGELAQRIRDVEGDGGGEAFDPGVHFPEAIRRVDVRVPAGQLAQSSAVLVDTPGLYTRMKFGYDRMTRDFRDTAACAVFVVKTDNLFLEQVFDEFNRLLELFGRIFLVVNLDTTKKDLRPDGSLAPSLEREDPVRIIEAFESLSMDAPLRAALDEGRLRIYPVDLLRAASRRIKAGAHDGLEPLDVPAEEALDRAKQADFDVFLSDLTEYLNSTDYLVAFLGDSLKHAESLLGDAAALCATEPVRALGLEVDALKSERETAGAVLARAERAESFEWRKAFADLRGKCAAATRERAREIEERTENALAGVLDRWFAGDDSLAHLLERDARSLLSSCQEELAPAVLRGLTDRTGDGAAGATVPVEVRAALNALAISLDVVSRTALRSVGTEGKVDVAPPRVSVADIPVRKGFWDWVLFRSQAAVRRRLFGGAGGAASDKPANRIPRALKAKRLGDPARQALRGMLAAHIEKAFPHAFEGLVERMVGDYAATAVDSVRGAVGAKRTECEGRLAEVEARLAETGRVREDLATLETAVASATQEVSSLTRRYGETDPLLLKQPVPEPAPVVEPTDVDAGAPESVIPPLPAETTDVANETAAA